MSKLDDQTDRGTSPLAKLTQAGERALRTARQRITGTRGDTEHNMTPSPADLPPLGTPPQAMVVMAHPDDAEFVCGGTVAKWCAEGAEVVYVVVTGGDKGTHDLEGYSLEDKGYFGPGELPTFDYAFFDIPRGTIEEFVLEQFKKKFAQVDSIDSPEGEALFEEFKSRLITALGIKSDALTIADEETPDYITQ